MYSFSRRRQTFYLPSKLCKAVTEARTKPSIILMSYTVYCFIVLLYRCKGLNLISWANYCFYLLSLLNCIYERKKNNTTYKRSSKPLSPAK